MVSFTSRYADAYKYAFENLEPFIEDMDLLAGLPTLPLSEDEKIEYSFLEKMLVMFSSLCGPDKTHTWR